MTSKTTKATKSETTTVAAEAKSYKSYHEQLLDMPLARLAEEAKKAGVKGYSKPSSAQRGEIADAILNALHFAAAAAAERATEVAPKPKKKAKAKEPKAPKVVDMPTARKLANAVSRLTSSERTNLRNEFAAELPKNTKTAKVFTAIATAVIASGELPESLAAVLAPKAEGKRRERRTDGRPAEALALLCSVKGALTRKEFAALTDGTWVDINGPLNGLVRAGFAVITGERGSYSWAATKEGRAAAAAAASA